MPLLMLGFFALQLDRRNIGNALTDYFLREVGIAQSQFNVGQQAVLMVFDWQYVGRSKYRNASLFHTTFERNWRLSWLVMASSDRRDLLATSLCYLHHALLQNSQSSHLPSRGQLLYGKRSTDSVESESQKRPFESTHTKSNINWGRGKECVDEMKTDPTYS
ncbi:hypothetical protein BJ170DRAFT_680845 [Xylariales sp. AK1849]|nr:hypothetical protein BJ170DRAFT_680845 [Xylariales sp. AK1849]